MWQLPPHRMKQPPRQRVEPPPDIVRPPAAANLAPRVDLNHPGTHLPKKDLTHKEWVLWQKHSPGQQVKRERSKEEHRGCAQRSQSTSFKEDAPKAKEPRCDSTKCLESARRQPAAQIEIDENDESRSSPRDEKDSERGTTRWASPARSSSASSAMALPRINVRIGRGNVRVGRGPCPLKRKRLGGN